MDSVRGERLSARAPPKREPQVRQSQDGVLKIAVAFVHVVRKGDAVVAFGNCGDLKDLQKRQCNVSCFRRIDDPPRPNGPSVFIQ